MVEPIETMVVVFGALTVISTIAIAVIVVYIIWNKGFSYKLYPLIAYCLLGCLATLFSILKTFA